MRSLNFDKSKPLLYLVPSPIGNLEEMSPRALTIIKEADLIACEDTRMTAKLLMFFNIRKPLVSLREHNEVSESEIIIKRILNGEKIIYMSDAGYPCISDPGAKLVQIAIENGVNVSCISGPNAALNALVSSGIDPTHFYFHGFLNAKEKLKIDELKTLANKEETLIFYEAPHRIKKTIESMYMIFGDRKACIGRKKKKKHEEYIRDTLKNLNELDENTLIGEMVIVVEGKPQEKTITITDEEIRSLVSEYINEGLSSKDAIKRVSEQTKINKNYVYKIYHIS